MTCNLCKSNNISFIKSFKPYVDTDWSFDVYDCNNCHARFALRDTKINYHETLHKLENSPYATHYNKVKYIKSIWTDLAEVENFIIRSSPVFKTLLQYIKKRPKDIKILEIGCSTGYVTAYLQEMGYEQSLGIDISKTAIEFAKKEFGPFYAEQEEKDYKYDVIFHSGLIGCVDMPKEFLIHYLDKLSADGVMIFNAPDVNSVKELKQLWVSTPPPDLIYMFDEGTFASMINRTEYKVLIEKIVSPFVVLYKNRFGKPQYAYPRQFIKQQGVFQKEKFVKKVFKTALLYILNICIFLKILKSYSDDYGLVIKIEKK